MNNWSIISVGSNYKYIKKYLSIKLRVRMSWLTIPTEKILLRSWTNAMMWMCVCVSVLSRSQSCLIICNPVDCSPLSMVFSWQVGSRLPFPSPGDLPSPVIEPSSSELAGVFFTTEPPGKPMDIYKPKYTCQWHLIFKNGKW